MGCSSSLFKHLTVPFPKTLLKIKEAHAQEFDPVFSAPHKN